VRVYRRCREEEGHSRQVPKGTMLFQTLPMALGLLGS
jgi:hypothetical protein